LGPAAVVYIGLRGRAPGGGGATPLAQRIAEKAMEKVLDPALGDGAGAKAFVGRDSAAG
jgi:hypothetical protein